MKRSPDSKKEWIPLSKMTAINHYCWILLQQRVPWLPFSAPVILSSILPTRQQGTIHPWKYLRTASKWTMMSSLKIFLPRSIRFHVSYTINPNTWFWSLAFYLLFFWLLRCWQSFGGRVERVQGIPFASHLQCFWNPSWTPPRSLQTEWWSSFSADQHWAAPPTAWGQVLFQRSLHWPYFLIFLLSLFHPDFLFFYSCILVWLSIDLTMNSIM